MKLILHHFWDPVFNSSAYIDAYYYIYLVAYIALLHIISTCGPFFFHLRMFTTGAMSTLEIFNLHFVLYMYIFVYIDFCTMSFSSNLGGSCCSDLHLF